MQRTQRILLHMTRCAGVILALLVCGRIVLAQETPPTGRITISDVVRATS
jgi:hypothetical protein